MSITLPALLTLATSEASLDHREPVALPTVAQKVLLAYRPEVRRLGLHVDAATQPAALEGDPLLVERLVANLFDNAVRHNVAGGRVEIATETKHGCAVLSMANTGPAIPPGEIHRLFQPFHRLNGRRAHSSGHGLGLTIVGAIATAHGAAMEAHAQPDGGLVVTVTFPPPIQAAVPAKSL